VLRFFVYSFGQVINSISERALRFAVLPRSLDGAMQLRKAS
jgi:hypothetical protein